MFTCAMLHNESSQALFRQMYSLGMTSGRSCLIIVFSQLMSVRNKVRFASRNSSPSASASKSKEDPKSSSKADEKMDGERPAEKFCLEVYGL